MGAVLLPTAFFNRWHNITILFQFRKKDGLKMSLPSRYSSNSERKHVHLRMTVEMWCEIDDDKTLYGSVAHKIRMILERYLEARDKRNPEISSGSPRESVSETERRTQEYDDARD